MQVALNSAVRSFSFLRVVDRVFVDSFPFVHLNKTIAVGSQTTFNTDVMRTFHTSAANKIIFSACFRRFGRGLVSIAHDNVVSRLIRSRW
jgi:hypothetical protein